MPEPPLLIARGVLLARMKEEILQTVFRLSRIGDRRGWEWLTYHPGVFAFYHWVALRQAEGVVGSLLAGFPDARSFGDLGAGTGVYAARLTKQGRTVVAWERSRIARASARLQGVVARGFDLTSPDLTSAQSTVDVAYCFEVAEHLRPHLGRRLVEFSLQLAPIVVFSAAQPGQGGQGHINEQPLSYWTGEFERAGAKFDVDATAALRKRLADSGSVLWIANNAQVFRHDEWRPASRPDAACEAPLH